ncbi:MAG: DUF599 domain-containing protein [Alphaproteobacteria bacterium]|nr:MAG: DUF599 domain-containing protein [Alphaproteobacteria bacterium]
MLSAAGIWDGVAPAVLFVVWVTYQWLFGSTKPRANSLNAGMAEMRVAWMRAVLARDNRIMDGQLVGHLLTSATFFASTTVLVLAGLVSALGAADDVYAAVLRLALIPGRGQGFLEAKILLLIAIFMYGFFQFTWAVRQFNYFIAALGAAPAPKDLAEEMVDGVARDMAALLSHAVMSFNSGIRAYYFALATFGWFLHPLAMIALTVAVALILVRRQTGAGAAQAVGALGGRLGGRLPIL